VRARFLDIPSAWRQYLKVACLLVSGHSDPLNLTPVMPESFNESRFGYIAFDDGRHAARTQAEHIAAT